MGVIQSKGVCSQHHITHMRRSDGMVRSWCKEHGSIYPSCLVSVVQAAGGDAVVWVIFFLGTILIPVEHHLNARPYPSLLLPLNNYSVLMAAQCQMFSDWFLEHENVFTVLKCPPQSTNLNPTEHLWGVME